MDVSLVENKIIELRGQKVILAIDLAELYEVPTKALNQAVKRNMERFPEDFMFQLTDKEKQEVVTNCDHLFKLKFSPTPPYAFTEHGAIMAANILNSKKAVEMSIFIVRAFVKMRGMLSETKNLSKRIDELEKKYDARFRDVFEAIKQLIPAPEKKQIPSPSRSPSEKRPKIGFPSARKKI